MKIIKIIQSQKTATENEIKEFIYRNMSQEMINGLEYDDPKTIVRALKMFGIEVPESILREKKGKRTSDSRARSKARSKLEDLHLVASGSKTNNLRKTQAYYQRKSLN